MNALINVPWKYHSAVPGAGVAAAVGVADAAGVAVAAAAVDLAIFGRGATASTASGVPVLIDVVDEAATDPSVSGEVAATLAVVVPAVAGVVVEAVGGETATAVGGVVGVALALVGVVEPGPAAAEELRGAVDRCLPDGRFRAGPAVPLARFEFEDVPPSFAELAFGPESAEPPSVAAAATP